MIVSKRKKTGAAIPTNSLADIAFLLLIFFLVGTTFQTERTLNLTLPAMGSSKPVPVEQIIRIEIDAQGNRLWQGELIDRKELLRRAAAISHSDPDKIFYIVTAALAKYSDYIHLIDDLRRAEVTRIAIHETSQ